MPLGGWRLRLLGNDGTGGVMTAKTKGEGEASRFLLTEIGKQLATSSHGFASRQNEQLGRTNSPFLLQIKFLSRQETAV